MSPLAMARGLTVCPRCGASVTPYAAGCGVCGADLEVIRRSRQARRRGRLAVPSIGGLPAAQDLFLTALMVVVALFAPLYGLLLALLVGFDRNRRGERTMRNMAVAAGAIALIGLFVPFLFWRLGPASS